jgi:N-acetylmuramoyl-L-alanine amidase
MKQRVQQCWMVPCWFVLAGLCIDGCSTREARDAHTQQPFVVAVDIGHTPKKPGARSAAGKLEYWFNKKIGELLHKELSRERLGSSFLVGKSDSEIGLRERVAEAETRGATVLLSIHHDSVQPHYLRSYRLDGEEERFCDKFRGFSLFVSRRNAEVAKSLALARAVASALLRAGLQPTLHHAEKIAGESRELLDKERGIYRYEDLTILATAKIPSVLIECGVIVNPEEEKRLSDPDYQVQIVQAIAAGIREYRDLDIVKSEKGSDDGAQRN